MDFRKDDGDNQHNRIAFVCDTAVFVVSIKDGSEKAFREMHLLVYPENSGFDSFVFGVRERIHMEYFATIWLIRGNYFLPLLCVELYSSAAGSQKIHVCGAGGYMAWHILRDKRGKAYCRCAPCRVLQYCYAMHDWRKKEIYRDSCLYAYRFLMQRKSDLSLHMNGIMWCIGICCVSCWDVFELPELV